MSALAPVGNLLRTRRILLPAAGIVAMAGFLGWVGAMIRFSRVTAPGDPMFAPLVAAGALVILPAAPGLIAGDAVQQVARRSALRLLPDLRERLLAGLLAIGGLVCVPLALVASPFRADLNALTALGPAALGYALGVLFPGNARRALAWVAALALPLLAHNLCSLATAPLAAGSMVLGAAVALTVHLRALLRPGAALDRSVTWLAPFATRAAQRRLTRGALRGDAEVAPPGRIVDASSWRAAHRFEQRATGNSIFTRGGTPRFVLVCLVVSMVAPILEGLDGGLAGVLGALVEAWVGPFGDARRMSSGQASTVVLVLWGPSAVVTAIAGAPLLGGFLYPLSRRARADLAARVARDASLRVFAWLLVLGAAFAATGLALVDADWPRALPTFAWVALVGLALAPWVQVLWLAVTRKLRARQDWRSWALLFAGLAAPIAGVVALWSLWVQEAGRAVTPALVTGYAVALVAGWAVHGPLLRRHFARVDLAG